MIKTFFVNGYTWRVIFVPPYDTRLIASNHKYCLGTTDPDRLTVYIDKTIHGSLLRKVLIHELGHCVIFSYNLIEILNNMIGSDARNLEEWLCNYLVDYGEQIFTIAYEILGIDAINFLPYEYTSLFKEAL